MKLNELKDCILVFDVDGVLVRYDFRDEDSGLMLKDKHTWIKANVKKDVYASAVGTELFDELIKNHKYDVHILSVVFSSFEQKSKVKYLMNRFPNLKEENLIFVGDKNIKLDMMKILREKLDDEGLYDIPLVLIEDTVPTMLMIESLHDERIRCYLISDFI